jgi:hypothetical protein
MNPPSKVISNWQPPSYAPPEASDPWMLLHNKVRLNPAHKRSLKNYQESVYSDKKSWHEK